LALIRRHIGWFATPRAILALILREMITTYGRSPGGYLWAVIEPAAGVALLTVIFSAAFTAPPLGTSFPLFYATGILPFLMFNDVSQKLGQTVQFSRALLKYPRVTFLDALLARFFLNVVTQIMVASVILGGIFLAFDPNVVIDAPRLGLALAMALSLAGGIGTLNSFLTLAWPLWSTIWAILTRPLFIVSGIFFVFEAVPRPFDDVLWFNPLIHVIGMTRDGIYPFYQASYVSPAYVLGLSAGCFITGQFFLWRYHRDLPLH